MKSFLLKGIPFALVAILLLSSCTMTPNVQDSGQAPETSRAEETGEIISPDTKFADQLVCPKSPVAKHELRLLNFSDLPDAEITNCFNFAVNQIATLETDVMLIMYPVGPLLLPPGEVQGNDTYYRGAGFTPVVTSEQRDAMASALEEYLRPACGTEAGKFQAWHVARYAELGGGQQVATVASLTGACSNMRWIVLSIDPNRAGPSEELVVTFFHEIFHTVQMASPNPPCTYSGDQADTFWIHEAGATYFALETSAKLAGVSSQVVWDKHMRFVSELVSQGLDQGGTSKRLDDPAIAEKGAIALRLLLERGQLSTEDVLDGSLFQDCGGQPDTFSPENMLIVRDYWSDYEEIDGSFKFSDIAVAP